MNTSHLLVINVGVLTSPSEIPIMHSNNSQNSGKGYLAYYSFIIAKEVQDRANQRERHKGKIWEDLKHDISIGLSLRVSLSYSPAQ